MFNFNDKKITPGIQDLNRRYCNYHTHTHYSNACTTDSCAKPSDYAARAIELGYTTISTCEHGSPLNYFETYEIAKKNNLKIIYATEAYFVIDKFKKDATNAHIILVAKNDEGRKEINYLCSNANIDGYYYKARTDVKDILSLNPKNVMITTACFTPGTRVRTLDGVKNIENITSDDYVLTHNNVWEKVNYPTSREYDGDLVSISTDRTNRIINSTDNHKYLLCNENEIIWVEAKDINVGDTLLTSIENADYSYNNILVFDVNTFDNMGRQNRKHINNIISIDENDMITFGLWLADGSMNSCSGSNRVVFTFNECEFSNYYNSFVKKTMDKFGIDPFIQHRAESSRYDVTYNSSELYQAFNILFENRKSDSKKIPKVLKHISKDFDKALLFGYLLGDGYFRYRKSQGGEIVSATVSEDLHNDIFDIYKSLSAFPGERIVKAKIDGNGVNHKESYYLSLSNSTIGQINKLDNIFDSYDIFKSNIENTSSKKVFFDANGVRYAKRIVKKIDISSHSGEVYCLNVGTSHSFNCEGIIVHNCLGGVWKYNNYSPYAEEIEELSIIEEKLKIVKQAGDKAGAVIGLTFGSDDEFKTAVERYKELKNIPDLNKTWSAEDLIELFHGHFGDSFYLEVQCHHAEKQIELNKRIVDISSKLGIKMIAGVDSHYIYPEQSLDRDTLLYSKKMQYEDEAQWLSHYPSYEELADLFIQQGVLSEEQIIQAMNNTLIMETFEDFVVDTSIKLPTIHPDKTLDEKNELLWSILETELKKYLDKNSEYDKVKYYEEVKKEYADIRDTGMADYFLLNYEVIRLGREKYNGVLTYTGRGSGAGFICNMLLGFTTVDRLQANVPMMAERFISKARILETMSLPDCN